MAFSPIAIVGQACLLPGAPDQRRFAENVLAGRNAVTGAPAGRWGLDHAAILSPQPDGGWVDRAWSDAGGYVEGTVPEDPAFAGLDPLVAWLGHVGRAALRDAGVEGPLPHTGAVFGNLSFPTDGMARGGERHLLAAHGLPPGPERRPEDAFMSGLPADLLARGLGLGAGAFALDAACASALYAIKLACDLLHAGRADRMLAGAVQRADNLFLHVGFCALGAMSKTGQSRPFHRGADGLVPAEGCAFVVLRRLADAEREGEHILGVIRGVGLSNDGRARGLLAPSAEGQERAMRAAWRRAGLDPRSVQLVECHATGTPTGDRTEVQSLSRLLGEGPRVPIGSLKSNLGHLITVAGVAGLQKVLAGFAAGRMPPTLHVDEPLPELAEAPLRLVTEAEPWEPRKDEQGSWVRRAAVSAFGFGGNNAHLVVEQRDPASATAGAARRARPAAGEGQAPSAPADAGGTSDTYHETSSSPPKIAIVGLAVRAGAVADAPAFAQALAAGRSVAGPVSEVSLPVASLRFPPNDLRSSLGQQTLLLVTAEDALADAAQGRPGWTPGPRERCGVVVGMGCDPAVTGWGLRWRVGDALPEVAPATLAAVREEAAPALRAEHVVGTMPNIPANRLNVQWDLAGFGFTVSHEELSGFAALAVAARALELGEADTVLVGAVDLATDPRAVAALDRLRPRVGPPSDGAVALVLRRLDDALAAGDAVWATLDEVSVLADLDEITAPTPVDTSTMSHPVSAGRLDEPAVAAVAGDVHAARALLAVAAAALSFPAASPLARPEARLSVHLASAGGCRGHARLGRVARGRSGLAAPPRRAGPALSLATHPFGPPPAAGPAPSSAPTPAAHPPAPPAGASPAPRPQEPPVAELAQLMPLPPALVPVTGPVALPGVARLRAALAEEATPAPAPPRATAPAAPAPPRATEPGAPRPAAPAPPRATEPGAPRPPVAFAHGSAPGPAASPPLAPSPVSPPPLSSPVPPVPSAPETPAPLPSDPVAAALVTHQRALVEAHRAFLESVAVAQQRFAAGQAGLGAALLGSASGAPAPLGGAPPAAPAGAPTPAASPGVSTALPPAPASGAAPPPAAPPAPLAPPRPEPARATPPAAAPPGPAARPPVTAKPASPAAATRTTSPAETGVGPAKAGPGKAGSGHTLPPFRASFPGPAGTRAQLEAAASGPVSALFGSAFADLDQWGRIVRMPEPPLLFADRVLGVEGPPGVLGRGTIWTETDIGAEDWYVHDGRMPGGILIESGQADLLLASWQGYDRLNQSERIYRLLGCDLTYDGALPAVGETLRYEIHIDGHAKLGGVRMFFFHYDCGAHPTGGDAAQARPAIHVRNGQAGFFSDAELAASGGVLWDAATAEVDLSGPADPPPVLPARTTLGPAELELLSEGRLAEVFGPGHALAETHTWTPRLQRRAGGTAKTGRTKGGAPRPTTIELLDRVELDPTGGPWGRGYLRAELDITPDLWFFEGHFKNDPCMPGTLMFEGCLQAMQVYMLATGHTLTRDGWRFEPAKGETFHLRCRGQVVPTSKKLVYELFVQSVSAGPRPRLVAQVLCTVHSDMQPGVDPVKGLKCFHADPLVIELVPDWPMSRMPATLGRDGRDHGAVAWDHRSLLACAWGRPSEAFGPNYARFDNAAKVPRLPGPPYHFMSRVRRTEGEMFSGKAGGAAVVEYDVPPDAWYFEQNPGRVMPFAVLLEAALQPCGWLASWSGCAALLAGPGLGDAQNDTVDVRFRNLDGKGTFHADVHPDAGTLTTTSRLVRVDRTGGMIIVAFQVQTKQGERPIYDLETVFGFFPPGAFQNQAGVGSTEAERVALRAPADVLLDLADGGPPAPGALRLPGPSLRMIDRARGYRRGERVTRWVSEKDIRASEWMFKAHFYGDPVQPGSLGIEAMIQLLQVHCQHAGLGRRFHNPRFEALRTGAPMKWKYRGQVTPDATLVEVELDVSEERQEADADVVVGTAHLWVDGKRIYSAYDLGLRIVEGDAPPPTAGGPTDEKDAAKPAKAGHLVEVAAPRDHCPTWVLPSLPMMTMALLALTGAEPGDALRDGVALRWCLFPEGSRTLHVGRDGALLTLSGTRGHAGHLSRGEPYFRASRLPAAAVELPAPGPLHDAHPGPDGAALYASGALFHGPSFHVVERVVATGSNGATLLLRAAAPDVLLDGGTHGIPHDHLESWCPELAPGQVGYPSRLRTLWLGPALPTGPVRCEVRLIEVVEGRRPRFAAWFYDGDRLCAFWDLEEALLPKGRIGAAPPADRRRFLLGEAVPGLSLAELRAVDGQPWSGANLPMSARLSAAEAAASDWLPGTLDRVYGTSNAAGIAARELVGAWRGVHPRMVGVEPVAGGFDAWDRRRPLHTVRLGVDGDLVTGTPGPGGLDLAGVTRWWRRHLGCGEWAGERMLLRLARTIVADLVIHDPDGLEALRGRPCLYLANHENYVESVVACAVLSWLSDLPLDAMAKVEHREAWLGRLHARLQGVPGVNFPGFMVFFDQSRPQDLPGLVATACSSRSLLVHVEGTRQVVSGAPVEKVASLWADVAVERGLPIVPLAFRGGLDGARVDLPVSAQDVHLGAAILPETLAALPYAERRKAIAAAINALPSRGPLAARLPWVGQDPGEVLARWWAEVGGERG